MVNKKGGSIASDTVLKAVSTDSFAKLSSHFTNLVGGCKINSYKIKNASIGGRKKGGALQYSIFNTGKVQSSENASVRNTNNDKFISQQSISSLPTMSKQTVYGIPTDDKMNFSFISSPIFQMGGKKNKK